MPWQKGRHRTPEEIIKIREGVHRYYSRPRICGIDRSKRAPPFQERINALKTTPLARRYYQFMRAKGLRNSTIEKELRTLKNVLKYTHKGPKEMSQEDVFRWVSELENNSFSGNYKAVLKTTIRSLFKFLGKPELVEWIKARPEPVRDRYVSLKEVREIIDSTPIFEEKLFFALIWEGCFRASELLNVSQEDIRFEKGVCYIRVSEAKNRHSERFVPILPKGKLYPLGSYGMLKKYIKYTNGKSNIRLWTWHNYKQIEYLFRKVRIRLGIDDLHAHLFRKSRASFLDMKGLSLKQLCVFGGWSINSRVVLQTYILCNYHDLTQILRIKNQARVKEGWN